MGYKSYRIITKNPLVNIVQTSHERNDAFITNDGKDAVVFLGLGTSKYLVDYIGLTIKLPFRFVHPSRWKENTIRYIKSKWSTFRLWFGDYILRNKIYVSKFSRDCDMVESSSILIFKNRKEFEDWKEIEYEWAEGTLSINRISEEEYNDRLMAYGGTQSRSRDRIMEAFENGRGWSVEV